MAHWEKWFHYLLFPFIIFILFYIYVLFVIATSKQLKSSYFRIFLLTGICDIQVALALFYMDFTIRIGVGPEQELITRIATFMTGTHYLLHLFGGFLMAFNQFTMIFFPLIARKYWTTRNMCIAGILAILYVLFAFIPTLFLEIRYAEMSPGFYKQWGLVEGRYDIVDRSVFIDFVTAAVVHSFSFGFMLLVVIKISREKLKAKMNGTNNAFNSSAEQRHLLFTLINSLLTATEILYDLNNVFKLQIYAHPILGFIWDYVIQYTFLIAVINAPMIVVTSKTVRSEIFKSIKKENSTKVFSLQGSSSQK